MLYQRLCLTLLKAYTDPAEVVSSLGKWCTTERDINLVQQMGVVITGPSLERASIMKSIKKDALLRGASASVKPLIIPTIMNTTGNTDALADAFREIEGMVNKEKSAKPIVNTQLTRKQMHKDLV